jgi:RimJ/RimL family protein N-acetyltransferase
MRLETSRLILRNFETSDPEAFARYRSDPEVAKYQSWDTPHPLMKADAIDFIEAIKQVTPGVPGEWYQVAIEVKGTGETIGDCAFCVLAEDKQQAEIGFTLARTHQGKGFAKEAVMRLLEYLFVELNLHRVRANCDPANVASVKLLQRIGMRCEGHFIKSLWFKGEWTDELWFAILRERWLR